MSRKRSLSKNLSRREPDDTEFEEALEEINKGSDMVAAIMGAALVENALIEAIISELEEPDNRVALFHEQGAPFGTLRSKTVAARAMGLFGDDVAADLDCIRDVRNQYAHALMKLHFDNPHIAEACRRLQRPSEQGGPPKDYPARILYVHKCMEISVALHKRARDNYTRRRDEYIRIVRENLQSDDSKSSGFQGGADNVFNDMDPD